MLISCEKKTEETAEAESTAIQLTQEASFQNIHYKYYVIYYPFLLIVYMVR